MKRKRSTSQCSMEILGGIIVMAGLDKVKIDNIISHFTETNERIADAIICNDEETWKKVRDYVTEHLDNHSLSIWREWRNYRQMKYFLRIDNGSTLTVMIAAVAIGPRGRRYTRMLVDSRINK